jgi:hypothetical protein
MKADQIHQDFTRKNSKKTVKLANAQSMSLN